MERCQDATYPFDCPGIYEIHVLGLVDWAMSKYLDGMTSAQGKYSDDSGGGMTVLSGWLPDQAALNGVLNTLYDHGYTLALVRQVEYSVSSGPA